MSLDSSSSRVEPRIEPSRRSRRVLSVLAFLLLARSALATPQNLDTLVMVVAFADKPAPAFLRYVDAGSQSVALTIPNAEAVLFTAPNSTAARTAEMSDGEITLTGDVVEVSLALNIGSSTSTQWRAAADAEAVLQGYTLGNYDRLAYVIGYGFSGQSSVGGAAGTNDWLWASSPNAGADYVNESTINHEVGHTLGLKHAAEILPGGAISIFGDQSDFMGSAQSVHTNAVNKDRAGWLLGPSKLSHTLDSTTSYLLRGLADTAPGLKVVVVDRHGAHADIAAPVDTYISYRKPINFDSNLTTGMNSHGETIRDKVHVHQLRKDGAFYSYAERALGVGEMFTTGLTTIEVMGIGPSGADVDVTQLAYIPIAPGVVATPVGSHQVLANTTVDYDIQVTNLDPPSVPFPAYFENSFVLPGPGWSVSWDSVPKIILLDPAEVQVVSSLRITSPLGETPGIYSVPFTLTNETGSSGPVSTVINIPYEVLTPLDTTPPPAPTGLYGNTYPGTGDDYIVLQWTEPPDVSDVELYYTYRNGVLLPPPVMRSPIYVDFFYTALESNAYMVRSVDAAGNLSEPSGSLVVGVPDVAAPSAVTDLGGVDSGSEVSISWSAAADNVWVEKYEIHRNGMLYATTWETSFVDTSPLSGVAVYTVYALDASGNIGGISNMWASGAPGVPSASWPLLVLLAVALAIAGVRVASGRRTPNDA